MPLAQHQNHASEVQQLELEQALWLPGRLAQWLAVLSEFWLGHLLLAPHADPYAALMQQAVAP